ncbi:hypothetical protein HMI54_012550, partial [Coelomomyces lativittatus]
MNQEYDMYNAILRRAPLNITEKEQCIPSQCNAIEILHEINYNSASCQTTSCYKIQNNGSSSVSSFSLVLAAPLDVNFKSNSGEWNFDTYGILSKKVSIAAFSNDTYCYNVPGKYEILPTRMYLQVEGYSCEIQVP